METAARDRLARLLDGDAEAVASTELQASPAHLALAVEGIGPVRFPITAAIARKLIAAGRPARFGHREQTLTDKAVRDTWEIPKHLVRAEWDEAVLAAALDAARDELELPEGCELEADFHSMLVYEKGQFFVAHQDTEKSDEMIGTLVVTLPSSYTGGDLVIGEQQYRGSKPSLSLVAFYADQQHEVLPVKSGYRVTLTYNLLLTGDTSDTSGPATDGAVLARLLTEHFGTPLPRHYGEEPSLPPNRLVYLLDHEYTPRGLGWSRLKGGDASRAALLRDAAGQAGCEAVLALADIQQTHSAFESGYDEWGDSTWDEYDEDEDEGEDDGEYDIQELIDSTVTLIQWTLPDSKKPAEIALTVRDYETCASIPTDELQPYSSEYEGYMGNYGNTLDRWYHRAAVVVWPREQAFANRAEASPAWALESLCAQARAGDAAGARTAAATLAPFWDAAARQQPAALFGKALQAGIAVGDPETAGMLLRPFRVELLVAADAASLTELAGCYGERWADDLVRGWFGDKRSYLYAPGTKRAEWVSALYDLCAELSAEDGAGTAVAGKLLELSWDWLRVEAGKELASHAPSRRAAQLGELGPPLAALLASVAVLSSAGNKSADVVLESVAQFVTKQRDEVLPWSLAALRVASSQPARPGSAGVWRDGAFAGMAGDCARRLRARLALPQRAEDDWSIQLPAGCTCELCSTLDAFLRSRMRCRFEWPLAKPGRQHIHSRIDGAELAVTHQTRRQGRPYTLVLAKTGVLFEREQQSRAQDAADLEWLVSQWRPAR